MRGVRLSVSVYKMDQTRQFFVIVMYCNRTFI